MLEGDLQNSGKKKHHFELHPLSRWLGLATKSAKGLCHFQRDRPRTQHHETLGECGEVEQCGVGQEGRLPQVAQIYFFQYPLIIPLYWLVYRDSPIG